MTLQLQATAIRLEVAYRKKESVTLFVDSSDLFSLVIYQRHIELQDISLDDVGVMVFQLSQKLIDFNETREQYNE
jgi:hypothetical protein